MVETTEQREHATTEIQIAVRHSVVYGLGGVLLKAIGFLMLPFYTHYLRPLDYGILEILDLSMTLFGMLLNMGITSALLRSYNKAESPESKPVTVSTAFVFVGITGLLTFVAGLALIRPVSFFLLGPGVPAQYLFLSFSTFILGYIGNLPRTYLRAREQSTAVVVIDSLSLGLMLFLVIYLVAVLKMGLLGVLVSSFIVGAAQALVLSGWLLREVGIRFSMPVLRQMVGFGLPLILSNIALFTLNFSDRFFLQHLRSLEVVGIYAVGYKFGFMMNYLLVQPFYSMWQARMYLVHAQPDHARIFRQIFILYSVLLTYAGLALSMFSPEIVHIMVGPEFSSGQNVIPLIVASYVFYGLGYYAQLGMFLTNRTWLIGFVSGIAVVLNVGLNYVLILHFGMLGAAWATLLSFMMIAFGSYWCSQRVFPLPMATGRVAMALLVSVGFYGVSRWWVPGTLLGALLFKVFLLALFGVVLLKSGILASADLDVLRSTGDKTMGRVSRLLGLSTGKAAGL